MADWYKNRILVIVCDGCGSVYYVPEATACRMPCENCGLKLECHGGEYRDLEDTDDGRSV